MSIPEQSLLTGVNRAWAFMQQRLSHHVGYFAREFNLRKQEEIKTTLQEDRPSIHLGKPLATPRLPSFAVTPGNETEASQFVGNQGTSNRAPTYLANPEDFEAVQMMHRVTYPSEADLQPLKMYDDGEQGSSGPRAVGPRRKNLTNTKEPSSVGDEQYERIGWTQRLWDMEKQRLFESVVGDQVNADIRVSCESAEKTIIYSRMLRWTLRRFNTWFHANGLYNIRFDLGRLETDESTQPTAGVTGAWVRNISVSFEHFDRAVEVETSLFEWIIEMEMVARRPDGGLDILSWSVEDDDGSSG